MGNAALLFRAVLSRELAVAMRAGGGWFYALIFFALFAALSGIAIGPEPAQLRSAAPAILWLASLLAIELSSAGLFAADERDGALRVLAAEQESLMPYVWGKAAAQSLLAGLPLLAAAPFLLAIFAVDPSKIWGAGLILAFGAPSLVLSAMFASALAAGLRAGGLLTTLIAAPFAAPPLIFGVLASERYILDGALWTPETLILCALSLFMAAIAPFASLAALRLTLE